MEIEQKQAELIDDFVEKARNLDGAFAASSLAALVTEATSHPSLFAFSEILSVPSVSELDRIEHSSSLEVLRLFAYGTWRDYRNHGSFISPLAPAQVRKLKQLTVLTLAETDKILPYDQLMRELDVSNVRELEDFLINDCMYAGIIRGKLDQLRRCFEVQFAAGRDLKHDQLDSMIKTMSNWLSTSESLLHSIQEKIKWADMKSEDHRKHRKEIEDKVEEIKKSFKLHNSSRPIWTYGATPRCFSPNPPE